MIPLRRCGMYSTRSRGTNMPAKSQKSTAAKTKKAKKPKAKAAKPEATTTAVDVVTAAVLKYCKSKKLSDRTTKSPCSLIAALMKSYPECPTEEQVRADLMSKGKSAKTISNTLWATHIWAASRPYLDVGRIMY